VRSSPEHLRAYLEIAAIWNESAALDQAAKLRIAENVEALANVVPLPSAGAPMPVTKHPLSLYARYARVSAFAAAALLCVGLGLGYQLTRAPVYTTEIGEQRSVRLVDGSTVELNSRTHIRVRYSRAERRIEMLSGQALFQVSHDAARPFIVWSDSAQVKAVGTRFDVNLKHRATVVTVIEGRVAIQHQRPDPTPVFLAAGEQITLTPRAFMQPTRTNVGAVTAWTQHQLVLDAAPLAEVAEEFNRYSARPLIVQDQGHPELRLSGVFSTDPEFLIRYLRSRPDITIHETDAEIRITRTD
jgi:transmembrane sensor